MPAFISAVRNGRLDLADFLLSSGIDHVHIKYPPFRFGTLMWLSYWLETLQPALPVLLRHGADVDVDLGDGHTLLIEACCRATYREAILLIEAGANTFIVLNQPGNDISMDNEDHQYRVSRRKVVGEYTREAEMYYHPNELPFQTDGGCVLLGLQPIEICSQPFYYRQGPPFPMGEFPGPDYRFQAPDRVIEILLRATPRANPMMIAAKRQDHYAVNLLLRFGFDVNATNSSALTPLMQAIRNKPQALTPNRYESAVQACEKTVRTITEYAKGKRILLLDGEKAMLEACRLFLAESRTLSIVATLVDFGISINIRNEEA